MAISSNIAEANRATAKLRLGHQGLKRASAGIVKHMARGEMKLVDAAQRGRKHPPGLTKGEGRGRSRTGRIG
jgi:hypothetical protein